MYRGVKWTLIKKQLSMAVFKPPAMPYVSTHASQTVMRAWTRASFLPKRARAPGTRTHATTCPYEELNRTEFLGGGGHFFSSTHGWKNPGHEEKETWALGGMAKWPGFSRPESLFTFIQHLFNKTFQTFKKEYFQFSGRGKVARLYFSLKIHLYLNLNSSLLF